MRTAAIALSAMAAAQQRLQAHAHNLANPANSGSDGLRRSALAQTALASGGGTTQWTQAAAAGPAMAEDLVGQLSARHAFGASLAVFKAHDAMTGALLDAVA